MQIHFQLLKKQRGYIQFLAIFLLLLISIVVIAYMELSQTHLKGSEVFKDSILKENHSISGMELGFYYLNEGFKREGLDFNYQSSIKLNEYDILINEYSYSPSACGILHANDSTLTSIKCKAFKIQPQIEGIQDFLNVVFIFDTQTRQYIHYEIIQ